MGTGSRLPTLVEAIERANREGDQTILRSIIERAADPRDFLDDPERHGAVIDYLNARLSYDGLDLQRVGSAVRLGMPGRSSSVVDALANVVVVIDFDTVTRDLDRALKSVEDDPKDAVTCVFGGPNGPVRFLFGGIDYGSHRFQSGCVGAIFIHALGRVWVDPEIPCDPRPAVRAFAGPTVHARCSVPNSRLRQVRATNAANRRNGCQTDKW